MHRPGPDLTDQNICATMGQVRTEARPSCREDRCPVEGAPGGPTHRGPPPGAAMIVFRKKIWAYAPPGGAIIVFRKKDLGIRRIRYP